jgi:hypothetical protein
VGQHRGSKDDGQRHCRDAGVFARGRHRWRVTFSAPCPLTRVAGQTHPNAATRAAKPPAITQRPMQAIHNATRLDMAHPTCQTLHGCERYRRIQRQPFGSFVAAKAREVSPEEIAKVDCPGVVRARPYWAP